MVKMVPNTPYKPRPYIVANILLDFHNNTKKRLKLTWFRIHSKQGQMDDIESKIVVNPK
jgi:hypothetical protein